MKRLLTVACILILLATPAFCLDREYWGVVGDYTEVTLQRDTAHFANLQFRNALSPSYEFHIIELSVDGVSVTIQLEHGKRNLPDTITVIVPDGFFTVPDVPISVEENSTITIEIHEMLIG